MNASASTETQLVSFNDEKYMVLDHEGNHDYDLVVTNHNDSDGVRTISLYLSMGHQWNSHVRGELVLSMTDTGNGVKFDRKLKKLDYSQFLYLRIILNFEHRTTSNLLDREDYIVMAMSNEIHV